MTRYERWGKRSFDLFLGMTAVVALSPLLALTAMAIKLEDRGSALFRQKRVGADGSEFTMLKFRSMPIDTPHLPSDAIGAVTITRTGRVIRRLNVDELPQLLNIVRGDMSIVGPRPALPSQLDVLAERTQNGARALRPGLTGLAQINSFNGMSPLEKARFDGEYAEQVTLGGDVWLILKTFGYLLKPPPTY
ncbi:sugar transferase [Dietzia sp. SYD-A1]|uniref:sugar transferase n=1 Tax=Dietzia sp. SYD-A1 TaxID=2780141 RepID=UPI0018918553|nr:sugar transferase [Dietzia sp. SYD-A1]